MYEKNKKVTATEKKYLMIGEMQIFLPYESIMCEDGIFHMAVDKGTSFEDAVKKFESICKKIGLYAGNISYRDDTDNGELAAECDFLYIPKGNLSFEKACEKYGLEVIINKDEEDLLETQTYYH